MLDEWDVGALSVGHYLILGEKAWEAWEREEARGVAAFLEAHRGWIAQGEIVGIAKGSAREYFEAEAFTWARIVDADSGEAHLVASWGMARARSKVYWYEDASILSLDTPVPMVLAWRVDVRRFEMTSGKVEVIAFGDNTQDDTFLEVSGEGVTLIVEGKPIRLGREEAKAFMAKLAKAREWRRALAGVCGAGLFIVSSVPLVLDGSYGWAVAVFARFFCVLLLILGFHVVWNWLVPVHRVGCRLFYERFLEASGAKQSGTIRSEVCRYWKWSTPAGTMLLTMIYFALLVGVLWVGAFSGVCAFDVEMLWEWWDGFTFLN